MNEEELEDLDGDDDLPPSVEANLAWAMMMFNGKFSEYIKELDPQLWKKAVDYAVTFTKVDGITFEYVKTATSEDVIASIEIEEEVDEDEEGEEGEDNEGSEDEWRDAEDDTQY